jgi:hypothetical protein
MSESRSAADQVGALINKGWLGQQKARAVARNFLSSQAAQQDAHFWFQYALAEQLRGDPGKLLEPFWNNARECANYTEEIEGDFYRDEALRELRRGNTLDARRALHKAQLRQGDDDNRKAAIQMVAARIAYKERRYEAAYETHDDVKLQFVMLGQSADQQWKKNNSLHMLRAAVRVPGRSRTDNKPLYQNVMRTDKGFDHRLGAWLAFNLGRVGNLMYDMSAKFLA